MSPPCELIHDNTRTGYYIVMTPKNNSSSMEEDVNFGLLPA